MNPTTNRCVKRCKEGQQRNEKFKCVKIKGIARKTTKNKKTKSPKVCPENKEMNPTTNRCVKRCKEDQQRNEKFKCVKTKK